jgi:hypothetical protein
MIRLAKIGEDEVDECEVFAVGRSPDGRRKMASAAVVRGKVNVRLRLPAQTAVLPEGTSGPCSQF